MLLIFRAARCRRGRALVLGGLALAVTYLVLFPGSSDAPSRTDSREVFATFRYTSSPSGLSNPAIIDKNTIPRYIHQTWKSEDIPDLLSNWVRTWTKKNPDWEYWFWTDEHMRQLIANKFPHFLSFYDSYPKTAYRIDSFRYFVLYEYGGLYVDMDVECLRSVDEIISKHDCLLSQEPVEHAHFLSPISPPLVSNALMACRPGHPFFRHVISSLRSYGGSFDWADVLRATGPHMLSELYKGYHHGWWLSAPASPVTLAEPEEFQPTIDESMLDHIKEMCLNSEGRPFLSRRYMHRQKQLCKRILHHSFSNSAPPEAYSNHHWTHTWAGDRHDPWGVHNQQRRTFKIRDIIKND